MTPSWGPTIESTSVHLYVTSKCKIGCTDMHCQRISVYSEKNEDHTYTACDVYLYP